MEVVAGARSSEPQNGFSAGETPSGDCDVHPVIDQMTTGPFNDSCGGGWFLGEVKVLFEVGPIGEQIVSAVILRELPILHP